MNLSGFLVTILAAVSPDTVTNVFILAILSVFGFSVYRAKRYGTSRLTDYTPNLLTSIGILGTFFGIVIGLMGFDPADIDHSITLLLGGLKTAFVTSLVGMLFSIIFKILSTTRWLLSIQEEKGGEDDLGGRLLAAIEAQGSRLEDIASAITGGSDSSLVAQFRSLRRESRGYAENMKQLLDNHRGYLKHIVAALIDGKESNVLSEVRKLRFESRQNTESMTKGMSDLVQAVRSDDDNSILGELRALGHHTENQRNQVEQIVRNTASIQEAIAGRQEQSIVSQLMQTRSFTGRMAMELEKSNGKLDDIWDLSRKQQESFDAFGSTLWGNMEQLRELLSRSPTEQVINALKEVITDFVVVK